MKTVDEYLDRLTKAHKYKPKFRESVRVALQPLVEIHNLLESLPEYFDIDTAIGAQLDVVGEWVNITRIVEIPVSDPWFRLDDLTRGLDAGLLWQPYDVGTYINILGDDQFRRLIKARIEALRWDGTVEEALRILRVFFDEEEFAGDYTVIADDKQVMQIVYAIAGKIPTALTLELFRGDYLPLGMAGVNTIKLVTSVSGSPIFGLDVSNDKIAGLDEGAIGVDPLYLILNPPTE